METVGTIQAECASLMQRTAVNDFITATGANLFYFAINNARRWAERAHDFSYSEIDVSLSIASTGSLITSAYVDTDVTAAGTLSPNVAGAFALTGTYGGLPFYTKTVSSVMYFLSYSGVAWTITTGGFTLGSNYWIRTTADSNPAGTYAAHGTNTGTLTLTQTTGTVAIKTIKNVLLPVADGNFPIEFLTNDEWNERIQTQVGRAVYNPRKTIEQIGIYTTNPVAYQQAQTVYLVPPNNTFTFPVISRLSVVRWLSDYTATTDTDFLIQRAPDYMMWGTLLEINKYFRQMVPRQEGNLDEESLTAERDAAFQALLAWDASLAQGTTTPLQSQQES